MEVSGRRQLDLRGVRCPLNWARAKVYLEQLGHETEVELWIDDPKGARNIPGAAEASGYAVVSVDVDAGAWRIVIST